MSVKIRLARTGTNKNANYRVVVTDSRKARNGQYLENLGTFDPHNEAEKQLNIDLDRAKYWLSKGAQTTETSHSLLVKAGLLKPVAKRAPKTDKKKKAE